MIELGGNPKVLINYPTVTSFKYSLVKLSGDNVTSIFISFKNFKEKMEDEEFEYNENKNVECKYIGGEIDLSEK